MQLRELRLEVAESLSDCACTALCQVSTLHMLFLSSYIDDEDDNGGGTLPISKFDLRGLQNITMVGLASLAPRDFKLPQKCVFVFWGLWSSLIAICGDASANLHSIRSYGSTGTANAFQHLAGGNVLELLTEIGVSSRYHVGTLQHPVGSTCHA